MPGITTPYNLQMPSAGLIGRGSGAGRSAIMDAAAIRTLTDTLTSTEVVNAISAGLATIDLSGKVSKSGDTMTGALSLGSNTLNCGAITASSTLTLQNATTAVLAEISKTYTSSTDREYLSLGYNSGLTGYFIGSRVGSAGGTARGLKIGHLAADGTTFIGLTVGTDGALSFNTTKLGVLTAALDWETHSGQARLATNHLSRFGLVSVGYNAGGQSAFMGGIGGWSNNLVLGLGYAIQMSSLNYGDPATLQAAADCQLLRSSTGPAWIVAANGGIQVRNFANSADAPITCGAITTSGQVTQMPPSSVTLATNGQFSIEMTSNTAGNLVYRGSDGTTRRAPLTFI